MVTSRLGKGLLAVNLFALFALALWLRITSLEMPAFNGDEAFYGVQASKLVHGESTDSDTASGNILNVLVLGADLPLYWALGPSSLVIKLPGAIAGGLAVIAAWFGLKRGLDPWTAAIATLLMAASPVMIAECRVGAEPAWNPLVGVLALAAAFRGHRLLTLLAFLLCFYVHPTYLFAVPIYGLVLSARIASDAGWNWRVCWKKLLSVAVGGGAVVGGLAWLTSGRSVLQWTYDTYKFGPMDWGRFWHLYERLLMGYCELGPLESPPSLDRAFWAVVLPLLAAGSVAMAWRRQWDRLSLVIGLIISLCGLHTVTGPDILRPYFVRYGLFFVAPTLVALACLARALVPDGASSWARRTRALQGIAVLSLTWVLLYHSKVNYVDHLFGQTMGQENFWTLRTESVDPKRWINDLLVEDLSAPGAPSTATVLAEDWWTYRPLEFLSSQRENIRMGNLERFDAVGKELLIRKHLEAGGYVVGTIGAAVPTQVESMYGRPALRYWHVCAPPYAALVLYRLKRDDEPRGEQPIALLQPPGLSPPPVRR